MKNILIALSLDDELLIPLKRLKDKISFENANVKILHVIQKEILSVEMALYEWPTPKEYEEIKMHAMKKIEHMKPHILGLAKPNSLRCEVILNLSARDAIIDEAKKMNAELIVVSTRGKKGIVGLFSSSMTDYLIKHSPTDLLVLRPNQ